MRAIEEAACIAIDAGFRHLQIHAAHGYLFSLLIDRRIYAGADDVLSFLSRWSSSARSSGLETSIRISLKTGDSTFDDEEGRITFQNSIAKLPFDFIDVSSGFYNIDKRLIYPSRPDILHDRRQETIELATRHPDARFIISGRAMLQSTIDLPGNIHIGLCRDLLANPDYLTDPARHCMNSSKCHYFSRGAAHVTCTQWDSANLN
jgi:NADPH2 dehydrogenase